jgi:hypothetical protein
VSATAATADGELGATGEAIETMIPRRLDRPPLEPLALAGGDRPRITWILDGP